MKCKEIIESLEQKYAPDFAESWDNVGLLVGDKEKEVHKIFLALDVTDESLEMAIKEQADMIITHHPLIFSAMTANCAGVTACAASHFDCAGSS